MKRGNLIFLILSVVTIVAGILIFLEASSFQKKADVTVGRVNASDFTYFYVKYVSADGVERTYKGMQSKNKKYHDGDTFKVFYLRDNPDISRIHDGKKGGKTAIFFGIAMLLLDFYLVYSQKSRNRSVNKIRTVGRKIQAEIAGIETDMKITILEKHPFLINCRWTDPMTGKEYSHVVSQLWKDPAPLLKGRNYLDVYIDRDDPANYFVDTEFLDEIKAY